jgi:pre-mRNA-splicing factor CWC22
MTQSQVQDMTEMDEINLRRVIYLTITSSAGFEECTHKLMKLDIKPGQEKLLCNMLVETCSQEKTYVKFYGNIGLRFALARRNYQEAFEVVFKEQYDTIHRLETNKLRNVAKFFAQLLYSDSIPWTVFENIRLNEDDTTSSSRIFIKVLLQELSEQIGLLKLKDRFNDPYMQVRPRDITISFVFVAVLGDGAVMPAAGCLRRDVPQG